MDKLKMALRAIVFLCAVVSIIIIFNSARNGTWDGVQTGLGFAFGAVLVAAFNKFVLKD